MINLSALKIKSTNSQVTGIVEFFHLSGRPYSMETNHGITFQYEGGSFSCKCSATLAQDLEAALSGQSAIFSRVSFVVVPATFGREKRAGFRPISIHLLESDGNLIYAADSGASESTKKK